MQTQAAAYWPLQSSQQAPDTGFEAQVSTAPPARPARRSALKAGSGRRLLRGGDGAPAKDDGGRDDEVGELDHEAVPHVCRKAAAAAQSQRRSVAGQRRLSYKGHEYTTRGHEAATRGEAAACGPPKRRPGRSAAQRRARKAFAVSRASPAPARFDGVDTAGACAVTATCGRVGPRHHMRPLERVRGDGGAGALGSQPLGTLETPLVTQPAGR